LLSFVHHCCTVLFVSLCTSVSFVTLFFLSFFFNDTATTEIYTLSLHDALPISAVEEPGRLPGHEPRQLHLDLGLGQGVELARLIDRKSTRLNSSHSQISYAVFCLKKKKKKNNKTKL